MQMILAALFLLLAGCASRDCQCGERENPHLTLQLPQAWTCQAQGSDVVCKTHESESLIIYTIKERGSSDTLENYKRRFTNAKLIEINGQMWVDSTQKAGELNGYTTRYLATVDGGYAALVTLSAPAKKFKQFEDDMRQAVGTLILRR